MTAHDRGGNEIELDDALVKSLAGRIRGELLRSGDAGYDESRALWNGMIDRRPALIVRCLGTADVAAGVIFARDQGIALCIRGGGHNIAGLAVCDGGLMLDMSRQRGVWVDPIARVARVQAGCLLGDVDRETQLYGLASSLGFVSTTGVAGLSLGGGFGYLTRRFGWTCDTLRSADVVTAEGRLVRASETENADLFWGLRGGGGNFGVVTSFEFNLYPVGPDIVGGAIAWPIEDAPRVLQQFRALMADAPPELTVVAALRPAPPAPWLQPSIHGKPIVALFVCHSGSVADGERAVAPLKAIGSPVGDIVQRRTYASQQSLLDATQPKGRRYYWKSEYLPGLNAGLLSVALEHASTLPSPHAAVMLFPIAGTLNRLPQDYSPAGNRDAAAVVNVAASWEQPQDDAVNIEWARAAWRDLRRFSTGGTYVNFLTEEEGEDRVRAAYASNFARLAAVKARWDPTNLFHANKNVAPAAVAAG
jgi:FAD/FMN-containing dehydrogenase